MKWNGNESREIRFTFIRKTHDKLTIKEQKQYIHKFMKNVFFLQNKTM